MPTTWLDTVLRQSRRLGSFPYPHWAAFLLDNPVRRLFADPTDLAAALDLTGTETVLELGPGSGFFSREVAGRLPDGRLLPFADDTFDVAYSVGVIGKVPDKPSCLTSLARVLKPGGLLVFLDGFPDPDRLSVDELRDLAEPAGFRLRDAGGTIVRDIVRFNNT